MFNSSNDVANMLTEHCQEKILLTLVLMLEKAVILHECYEDLADVELALDNCTVALKKLLNGLLLASDCGEI